MSTLALKCFMLACAITHANEAQDRTEKWKHFRFLNVSGKEKPLYLFHQNQKQVESGSNTERWVFSDSVFDHFIQPRQQICFAVNRFFHTWAATCRKPSNRDFGRRGNSNRNVCVTCTETHTPPASRAEMRSVQTAHAWIPQINSQNRRSLISRAEF